jgi:hypothetical protein
MCVRHFKGPENQKYVFPKSILENIAFPSHSQKMLCYGVIRNHRSYRGLGTSVMIQSLLHLGHLPPGALPGRWTADTQPSASGVVTTMSSRAYTTCGHIDGL